ACRLRGCSSSRDLRVPGQLVRCDRGAPARQTARLFRFDPCCDVVLELASRLSLYLTRNMVKRSVELLGFTNTRGVTGSSVATKQGRWPVRAYGSRPVPFR